MTSVGAGAPIMRLLILCTPVPQRPCGFHLERRLCGGCAGGGGAEETTSMAGRGEKGGGGGDRKRREKERWGSIGHDARWSGGKGLDCRLIPRTLRFFFCKINNDMCQHANEPPMLRILWLKQRGVGFKQP